MNLKQTLLIAVHAAGVSAAFFFRRFLTDAALRLISGAARRILGPTIAIKISQEASMLEGKEIDQKIGNVGSYYVDVDGDGADIGKVDAGVELSLPAKELVPGIPGALIVEGSLNLKLTADPVALALHEMQKLNSGFAKMVADSLTKLRAGGALDAHVQTAVDAHPVV